MDIPQLIIYALLAIIICNDWKSNDIKKEDHGENHLGITNKYNENERPKKIDRLVFWI